MSGKNGSLGATGWFLFEPDTVLPWQLDAARQRRKALQPERQLMLAVLDDAVSTFCKHLYDQYPRKRRVFAEVEEWFASDDTEWPYSFVNICQSLDLDISWVRSRIDGWRAGAERCLAAS